MDDTALLPQDLICVLIDDGGFLVLSNQEDHWYQVSGALSSLGQGWDRDASQELNPKLVAVTLPHSSPLQGSPCQGGIWVQIGCPHFRWASSSVKWMPT